MHLARNRILLSSGIIVTAISLRLVLVLLVPWSNSSDLNNYLWDALAVREGRNPYQLWQENLSGPRADLPPLELALLSLVVSHTGSAQDIRLFFVICDLSVLLLLSAMYWKSPNEQINWLMLYGFGLAPLYLFTLVPTDKPLLFALLLVAYLQVSSHRRWTRWSSGVTVGILGALKWLGAFFAIPLLGVASHRNGRTLLILCGVAGAVAVVSHVLWFPTWRVVYEWRAARLAGPPFHAGVAVILQHLGLPMQRLYYPLMCAFWAGVTAAWWWGWLDWRKATALSVWACTYWAPDVTPQMLWFVSLVLLLSINWTSRSRIALIWGVMLFETFVAAISVYPMIGGPVDLSWATPITRQYGSVRVALLSQFLVWMCLFWVVWDAVWRSQGGPNAGAAQSMTRDPVVSP